MGIAAKCQTCGGNEQTCRCNPANCGRTHEEWLEDGCAYEPQADICDQCMDWEGDYWHALESPV